MSIEGHPSISSRPLHRAPSAASETPAHPLTDLAAAKLPVYAKHPQQESAITSPVNKKLLKETKPPLAPLKENATFEELKQYLIDWVMENPQTHTKETVKKILVFLLTKTPQGDLHFDATTCELPDIFHLKLVQERLKVLSIHSDKITQLPSLGPLTGLLHLDLKGCTGLTELPADIGVVENLVRLDLNGCTGLRSLPNTLVSLTKLTITGFGDCSQLTLVPQALLHQPMSNGQTLLNQAIIEKNENGVRLLTHLGASLNQSAGDGHTPMTRAVLQNDASMLRLLKSLDADVNQPSANGYTPLICAINEENMDMIEFLLDELKADINQPGGDGNTPLVNTILEGNTELAKWLINKKANVKQLTGAGYSPLMFAIVTDNADMVTFLSTHGVNVNKPANAFGETPLILAILSNKPDIVKLLVHLGASIHAPGQDGEPPIAKALLFDLPNMVHLLKTLGANQRRGEKLIKTKFLAHAWGVKGMHQTDASRFNLELLPSIYSKHMLEKYVSDFFKSEDFLGDPIISQALSTTRRKTILQAIAQGFPRSSSEAVARGLLSLEDAAEIVEQIQSDEPFMILGGTRDHGISMVLHDDMLILFNRGERNADNSVRSYHLSASMLTPEIIAQLTNTQYQDTNTFYSMIDALHLLPANVEWSYIQKLQEISNCAWVSAKGAFGILCKLLADPPEIGELIYKKFATFVRKQTFDDFRLEYGNEEATFVQQAQLMKFIEKKGIRKGIFPAKQKGAEEVA